MSEFALIEEFLENLAHVRRASMHTLKAYRSDLTAFKRHCVSQQQHLQGLDRAFIQQYVASRFNAGTSPRSIHRAISAIRAFYQWVCREYNWNNPATHIHVPKKTHPLPKTLHADQITYLLENKVSKNNNVRDHAMMELMYSCGLRVSELSGINLDDINLQESTLRITGKGSKVRILPIGTRAVDALKCWLKLRSSNTQEVAIFLNRQGKRISARGIQLRVKQYGMDCALNQKLHPHMLRHSFATHILEAGCDLRSVQELLGHSKLSTTQIYTQLNFQHLAETYDKAHPRSGYAPAQAIPAKNKNKDA